MTTSPVRAPGLRSWRRSALLAGALATVAWVLLLIPVLRHGPSANQNLIVGLCALVLSFLTTHLLRRMWTDPAYQPRSRAELGRRLAAAFEILLAITIVVGLVDLPGVAVLGAVLGCAALASFLAALALALPRPDRS
jgi:hypothetical protein